MTTLLFILWGLNALALLVVVAMHPKRTASSWFELRRLKQDETIRREKLLDNIFALLRVVAGLLFVSLVFLGLGALQGLGVVASVGFWLVAGAVSRVPFVRTLARSLYGRAEPTLLDFVERVSLFGWLLRADKKYIPRDQILESPEHLLRLVEGAGRVLSDEQQAIITQGLYWHTTTVESVMTPARAIVTVKNRELLGPLVLDDLHKSGHSRFPVVRGSIDTIVGILTISELLDVTSDATSRTVEAAMSPQVLRIESDEPLPSALSLLEKSHQHMLIVVDPGGKTVGLLTLADITNSLLGKNRGKVVK